ncbi:MarR family winged helix-turn-helix transcriptional regulator [Pseudonocardia sp. WMMC193]|uniref:MarR family winged helix-turn-helix transcriptional regulator n=1 Tax=Pseudonocardia sp. WMMC193 TaxID=2911965 RepID=UPI001F0229E3|nr:MarR family transcriptional regulator [Pseudonocardia sp. WMMC193]MCF7553419.1 MarR family transcriptional regulator [Pseudonocardia sp. WMMC193]
MQDITDRTSLALRLAQVARAVNGCLAEPLAAGGLSLDQYRVLLQLADGEGHAMADVALGALIPAPTLTRVVDRLVNGGLLHRRVDPLDRRRVLLFLSHRGRPVLRQVQLAEEELQQRIEARLGVADLGRLVDDLDRLERCVDGGDS